MRYSPPSTGNARSSSTKQTSRHGSASRASTQSEFTKYYRSFSVQLSTKRADELSRSHRLPSVPVLVIDGKYMIRIADNGKFDEQLEGRELS